MIAATGAPAQTFAARVRALVDPGFVELPAHAGPPFRDTEFEDLRLWSPQLFGVAPRGGRCLLQLTWEGIGRRNPVGLLLLGPVPVRVRGLARLGGRGGIFLPTAVEPSTPGGRNFSSAAGSSFRSG